MALAIKAENVSKAYQLGQIGTGTLGNDLTRWFAKIKGKEDPFLKVGETNDRTVKGTSDVVWSLKDINFEIKEGDSVGVIGRNGAGKSTLLKLLSRVTSPTTGEINVKGRIASLLEVGTGFHPELSGRENIFLNGAILGMRKKEIQRKFDEIVDFSGVERYIDTPVKRYSSGMYVRLAFAVAAHLESEILIVDEVLAVGDAEFQRKCLGKMGEVSKGEGRTILFVSHNMASVLSLCNKGIVLANGKVVNSGSTASSVSYYTNKLKTERGLSWVCDKDEVAPVISKFSIELMGDQPNYWLEVSCTIEKNTEFKPGFIAFDISNSMNVIMQAIPTLNTFIDFKQTKKYQFRIDLNGLVPDFYNISVWIGPHNTETYTFKEEIVSFEILKSPTLGRIVPHTFDHGFIVPNSMVL